MKKLFGLVTSSVMADVVGTCSFVKSVIMQITFWTSVLFFNGLIEAFQCQDEDTLGPKLCVPSKVMYVAVHESLVLNCTISNVSHKDLASPIQLRWKHNNTWLINTSNEKYNNTVLLKKENISFQDGGTYECRVFNFPLYLSQNVTVVVGVKPSKQWEPYVTVYGLPPQNMTFSWRGSQGTLSSVLEIGVLMKTSWHCEYRLSLCKQIAVRRNDLLTCSMDPSILLSENATDSRKNFICAVTRVSNVFGSSQSMDRWWDLNQMTKCPMPRDFRVSVGDKNLRASWLRPPLVRSDYPLGFRLRYKVTSLLTDEIHKPEPIDMYDQNPGEDGRFTWNITYRPYRRYEFSLRCYFVSDDGPKAVTEVVTREAAPFQAPVIYKCVRINRSLGARTMDVLLSWKLPPKNTWNGIPRKFIAYSWQGQGPSNVTSKALVTNFNGSFTEGVLKNRNPLENLIVRLVMCTGGGCGGLSSPCDIKADNNSSKGEYHRNRPYLEDDASISVETRIAIALIGVSVGLVLVVFVARAVCKKRLQRRGRESLSGLIGSLNDFPRYENELDDRPPICEASLDYDEVLFNDSLPLLEHMDCGLANIPVTSI